MKFGKGFFSMLAAVVFALLCGVGGAFSADYVEGEVLAVLESNTSAFASSVIAKVSGKNIVHLRSATKSTEELMRELMDDPRVVSVQPNYIYKLNAAPSATTPNDPLYSSLWGMRKIKADEAWDSSIGNGSVVVAVIDSGIDYNHEDLKDNMVKDSANNYGYDFVSNDVDPMDDNGHGTHVAGTIGAVGNNKTGVAGVAWKVGLLAVKIADVKGEILASDVIAGIAYLLKENRTGPLAGKIKVANMSFRGWQTPQDDSPYGTAIKSLCDAGMVLVIGVGNDSQNINSPSGEFAGKRPYPAAFRFSSTISVGATTSTDTKSWYSNYGNAWVDIAAPGGNHDGAGQILSTVPKSYDVSGYANMNGTSMATPHVAGAAALLFMAFPDETAEQIKDRILDNADADVGIREGYWANGRLDIRAAFDDKGHTLPIGTPGNVELSKAVGINIGAVIEKMGGKFKQGEFIANKDGKAVVRYEVAKATAAGVIGKGEEMKHAVLSPAFTATLIKPGNIAATSLRFSGSSFFAGKAEDIKLLKILSSSKGELFKFTSVPADVRDGMFAVQKLGAADFHSGVISADAQYRLWLFIEDGGEFDLDGKEDGSVIDPAALLKIETVGSGGGGGGGCVAGFFPFVLLCAVPLIFRKKV